MLVLFFASKAINLIRARRGLDLLQSTARTTAVDRKPAAGKERNGPAGRKTVAERGCAVAEGWVRSVAVTHIEGLARNTLRTPAVVKHYSALSSLDSTRSVLRAFLVYPSNARDADGLLLHRRSKHQEGGLLLLLAAGGGPCL